ncbi:unnamed protein product [Echinostoma caproni]|uniref:Transposase n=1 Tax=Echinostoma caproni TaxID=27848 RepID=A0A183AJG8_9TREM|nr:unnamed protein product [Echinostoma caproni]
MDRPDARRNSSGKGFQGNDAAAKDVVKSVGKGKNRTNEIHATKVTNRLSGKVVDDTFTVELAALKEKVRQLEAEIKSVKLQG